MANKIKFGLRNVYYALATIGTDGTATYGTPVKIPGAVDLSLDPTGEMYKFYADDIAYFQSEVGGGYEGDLEIAVIPDGFRTAVLGDIVDSDGAFNEPENATAKPFALLFEFQGDANAVRHVLYNCVATRPGINGHTKEENTEAQTETLSLTAAPIFNDDLGVNIVKSRANYDASSSSAYQTWFTSVHQATGLPSSQGG